MQKNKTAMRSQGIKFFCTRNNTVFYIFITFHSLAISWAYENPAIKLMLYVSFTMMCLIKEPLYFFSFP